MAFDPSNVDVEDFLDVLEVRNVTKATADEFRFSCPFPGHDNGDEHASCYMNEETSKWFCHGCKRKGDAVNFATYVLSISPLKAIRMLREVYQPGFINPDARSTVSEVRKIFHEDAVPVAEQPQLDESLIERFAIDWDEAYHHWTNGNGHVATDYILDRNFGPFTLDEWEFGYDEATGRITFAVRDVTGQLIGFKGRACDGREPKYLVLGDKPQRRFKYGWDCYHTSKVVFGAHKVKGGDVVICEGELNAVAMWERSPYQAVAVNGSYFTDVQAKIIRNISDRAIIFLDSDKAGWENTERIVEMLKPHMSVSVVPDHEGDAAEMNVGEDRVHFNGQIEALIEAAVPWSLWLPKWLKKKADLQAEAAKIRAAA